MTVVYLVKICFSNVDDEYVDCIFSTKEKAESYVLDRKDKVYSIYVQEYELDSEEWV